MMSKEEKEAWEEYNKAIAPAEEAYEKASEEYQKAIAPVWEICQKRLAETRKKRVKNDV